MKVYKAFAALTGAAAKHDAVAGKVKKPRERLRAAMRDTLQNLTRTTTSAEVLKLQAVIRECWQECESADSSRARRKWFRISALASLSGRSEGQSPNSDAPPILTGHH